MQYTLRELESLEFVLWTYMDNHTLTPEAHARYRALWKKVKDQIADHPDTQE